MGSIDLLENSLVLYTGATFFILFVLILIFRLVGQKNRELRRIKDKLNKQNHELIKKEASLLEIQSIAKVGSWEIRANTMFIKGSKESYAIWGLNPLNESVHYTFFLDKVIPNDKHRVDKELNEALQTKTNLNSRFSINTPSGEIKTVHVSARFKKNINNEFDGFIGAISDITDQVRYQNLLKEQKEEAEKLSGAKSAFLANISHEVRTPLNAIVGLCYLIDKTLENKQHKQYIAQIRSSASTLLDIINDILDFSKMEANKLELHIAPFDLRHMISEISDMFTPKVVDSGIDFQVDIDQDIPHYLLGDKQRIKQVIVNLVSNSFKFTNVGKIILKVHGKQKDEGQILLKFSVKDTGIGIDSKDKQKLFEEFSQIDTSSAKEYGGTGLGLAICKGLINMMGSTIKFHSEKDVGSTFGFEILLKIDKEFQKEITDNINDSNLADHNNNILVVDDDEVNRAVVGYILRDWNFEVAFAKNGLEAVEKAKENLYDIILMDLQMPELDGYDAAQEIKKDKRYKDIPIVSLSADVISDDPRKKIFNDAIAKPIDPLKFLKKLKKWFDLQPIADKKSSKKEIQVYGLDTKKGLSKFANDYQIYIDLLLKFAEQQTHTEAALLKLLELEDINKLKMIIHTLKGVAGNISAPQLFELCKDFEKSAEDTGYEKAVMAIYNELKKIIASIHEALQKERRAVLNQASEKSIEAILQKIEIHCHNFSPKALQVFKDAQARFKKIVSEERLKELYDALNRYEFEEALEMIENIYKDINNG